MRQALNVEAGLNDGLSVPFPPALFLTLAVAEEELQPASYWIRFALEQIGLGAIVGIGVGLAGSWLVRWASRKGVDDPFQRLALAWRSSPGRWPTRSGATASSLPSSVA